MCISWRSGIAPKSMKCITYDTHTRGGKWCKNYDTGAKNKGRRLRLLEHRVWRSGRAIWHVRLLKRETSKRCACARHIVMFETLTACQYYYKRVHQSAASSQCKLTVEGAAAPHRAFAFLTDQLNRHITTRSARSHDPVSIICMSTVRTDPSYSLNARLIDNRPLSVCVWCVVNGQVMCLFKANVNTISNRALGGIHEHNKDCKVKTTVQSSFPQMQGIRDHVCGRQATSLILDLRNFKTVNWHVKATV